MSDKVLIYSHVPPENKQSNALASFAKGLKKLGVDHEYFVPRNAIDFQTRIEGLKRVAFWTMPKQANEPRLAMLNQIKNNDGVAIIFENGYVKRDIYHSIGLNGMNGRADFRNARMPRDRWKKLGVRLAKTWKPNKDGYVLICGQVQGDRSLEGTDNVKWCREIARKIPERHRLVYRPHPVRAHDVYFDEREVVVDTNPSIEASMRRAKLVVCFSSNCAVDAVIAGVPIYVESPHSVAYPLSIHLHGGRVPDRELVKQWAWNLAYAQWTKEEMEEGLPWKHLFPKD